MNAPKNIVKKFIPKIVRNCLVLNSMKIEEKFTLSSEDSLSQFLFRGGSSVFIDKSVDSVIYVFSESFRGVGSYYLGSSRSFSGSFYMSSKVTINIQVQEKAKTLSILGTLLVTVSQSKGWSSPNGFTYSILSKPKIKAPREKQALIIPDTIPSLFGK